MAHKEALEVIRTYHNQISLLCKGKLNAGIINAENQIEQDLDRLERLEKAFKILANKEVNLIVLKYFIEKGDGVEAYNLYYTTKERLTKEEYELLKEALENDK